MRRTEREHIEPYLVKLQEIRFIAKARVAQERITGRVLLHLDTRGGDRVTYRVERLEGAPTGGLIGGLLAAGRPADGDHRQVLLAPEINRGMAELLREGGIDYLDLAGNCHMAPTPDQVVHIEGRKAIKTKRTLTIRPQGYQVLFALLAQPGLVAKPVREIAEEAGVGKTVVGQTIERLEEEGRIRRTRRGRVLFRPAMLLPRWLTGYADILRPRFVLGQFRAPEAGRDQLPERITAYFDAQITPCNWGFGGTTAGDILTGHYRGPQITLHVEEIPQDFGRTVRLLPANDGDILLLRAPGPAAYKGQRPNVVHPLLVYTELMAGNDERAWEMGRMVLEEYLPELK